MYNSFYDFELSDEVLASISNMGFVEPTQIQKIAIAPVINGEDIIGIAQTGTGKTAAFGIPIVEKKMRGKSKTPYALVLVPTRELAMQVVEEINKIGQYKGIVSLAIYGGQSIERQIRSLRRPVDVVVGTPGRIIDHIRRHTLDLSQVATVVLDEADEMLNLGFIEDMETILSETPKERQTLLFSATMPHQIINISKKYMISPKKVHVETKGPVVEKIRQIFYDVREKDKLTALTRIIDVYKPPLSLVFCHTKRDVDKFSTMLKNMGYGAGGIHGDFTQSVREEMIAKFKENRISILVATDVAARGLDINDVTHVINFTIPQNPDSYIHRIGRTGRAGKSGTAITFVTPSDYGQLRTIERIASTKIKRAKLPTVDEVRHAKEKCLVGQLEAIINEGKHEDFMPIVKNSVEKYGSFEVAAAALSLSGCQIKVEHIDEVFSRRNSTRSDSNRRKAAAMGKRHKHPSRVFVAKKSKQY